MDTLGLPLLTGLIAVALLFDFLNGLHDAANSIATVVSTRVLRPQYAVFWAAFFNFVAFTMFGLNVAHTIGTGIIDPAAVDTQVIFAALVGAIVWNLVTWWLGLPSSSSHALIGGLVGAALASSGTVMWSGVFEKVVVPMVLSPVIGLVLGYLFMLALLWTFQKANPTRAHRGFRRAQVASAAAMAFGHGTQDAQKTMGVIALTLVISGHLDPKAGIPDWVIFSAAGAIALGTYSGGWRIMRTVGRRIYSLSSVSGFGAQTVASGVLFGTAAFGLPVSTTHVISSSIMGVGATRRLSAVRWGVAGNIVIAWVLTIPAAAAVAALIWVILSPLN